MQDPSEHKVWRLDGEGPLDTMEVASRLARLEPIDGLRYRGVALDAVVVDVVPCRRTAAGVFYRCFRLRPLAWAKLGTPCPDGLPEEWASDAISIPRQPRDGMESKLSRFETEFAVYTFLQGVEREIDARLQRNTAAAQRGARARPADGGGAPYGYAGCES